MMTQRYSHKHHYGYLCWKIQALQRKTDLWCAYLDPIWFHSVEVLIMCSYNLRIARKWACCTREVYKDGKFVNESQASGKLFGQSDINFNVLPLMSKVVPDGSYTVTCLPLQTVTESCLFDKTHLWDRFLFSKWHVLVHYLAGTHSLDVRVWQQGKVCSGGEPRDAELGWRKLHCCHLLTVVGWHEMLTQDEHSVWIIGCQQIQTRAPLKQNIYMSASSMDCCWSCIYGICPCANTQFLQTFIQIVPVAEPHFPQFQWVSAASTRLWYQIHCCLSAPSSILLYAHSWYHLPRFLEQHYTK